MTTPNEPDRPSYGQPGEPDQPGRYGAAPDAGAPYGYGDSPYGPSWGDEPPAQQPRNGLGVASLVLGIVALLAAWLPLGSYVAVVLAIVGLVLGIVGIRRVSQRRATNRGVAISGVVVSAVALLIALVFSILYSFVLARAANCSQYANQRDRLEQCVQNEFNR